MGYWSKDGSYDCLLQSSGRTLHRLGKLDRSILHGDGSTTVAKKGAWVSDTQGHKHQKGEKELAIADTHGHMLAPVVVRSVNVHDSVLFPESFNRLLETADLLKLDWKIQTGILDGITTLTMIP